MLPGSRTTGNTSTWATDQMKRRQPLVQHATESRQQWPNAHHDWSDIVTTKCCNCTESMWHHWICQALASNKSSRLTKKRQQSWARAARTANWNAMESTMNSTCQIYMYQLSTNMPQAKAKQSKHHDKKIKSSQASLTMPKNDSPCHYLLSMKILNQKSWFAILYVGGFACISSLNW